MLNVIQMVAGPYDENAYLSYMDGRDDAFVVDPGGKADAIAREAEKLGKRITNILITHGHFDHILGAEPLKRLTGAKVSVHGLDEGMLQDTFPLKLPHIYEVMFRPMSADVTLSAGDIELCGAKITVIHTPGHTPGGVSYYIPDERVCFTGDTLFKDGFGRTDFANSSSSDLRESLRALFKLPPETVIYSGHGDSARLGDILEKFRWY